VVSLPGAFRLKGLFKIFKSNKLVSRLVNFYLGVNQYKLFPDMTKEFWINLPVKDLERSKRFFTQLGFSLKATPGNNDNAACLLPGSGQVQVMLFEESVFKSFTGAEIADTGKSSEVLFSIDAENKMEVNEIADRVEKAGGLIFAQPAEKDGWMYGFGFKDPDGHRWNVLFMDMTKTPKQRAELQIP
jgi:predicted lactoylglutathione lyase